MLSNLVKKMLLSTQVYREMDKTGGEWNKGKSDLGVVKVKKNRRDTVVTEPRLLNKRIHKSDMFSNRAPLFSLLIWERYLR